MMSIAALFLAIASAGAQTPSTAPVRVNLLSLLEPQRVVVRSSEATLELPGGARLPAGECVVLTRDGGAVVARTADGWSWRGQRLTLGEAETELSVDVRGRDSRSRVVRGNLTIGSNGRLLYLIAVVDLEDLVASSVAAELEHVTDRAALESAAVAIRSYLVANRGRHASDGYDVCDTTHCLFSKGLVVATDRASREAVAATRATRGIVLERRGHVVAGYVAACCGGRTAVPVQLWGGPDSGDYQSVVCTACVKSPFYRWRRVLEPDGVARAVESLAGRATSTDIEIAVARGLGGWVRQVVIRTGGREYRVGGDEFRMAVERRLGWNTIPSPRFTIERVRGVYVVRGGGFGHGIGLCVAGAVASARHGATRDELLTRYFPRARTVLLREGQ